MTCGQHRKMPPTNRCWGLGGRTMQWCLWQLLSSPLILHLQVPLKPQASYCDAAAACFSLFQLVQPHPGDSTSSFWPSCQSDLMCDFSYKCVLMVVQLKFQVQHYLFSGHTSGSQTLLQDVVSQVQMVTCDTCMKHLVQGTTQTEPQGGRAI